MSAMRHVRVERTRAILGIVVLVAIALALEAGRRWAP
jgi:hypothetical protein